MTSIALFTALTVVTCHGAKCAPAPCPAPEPVCVVVEQPCPPPPPVCEPVACAPKKCHMPKLKMPKISLFKKCHKPACEPVVYAEPCATYEAPVVHPTPQATPQSSPQMMAPPAPKKAARLFAPGSIVVYRAN